MYELKGIYFISNEIFSFGLHNRHTEYSTKRIGQKPPSAILRNEIRLRAMTFRLRFAYGSTVSSNDEYPIPEHVFIVNAF